MFENRLHDLSRKNFATEAIGIPDPAEQVNFRQFHKKDA